MNQILFTGDKQEKTSLNNIIRVFCVIIIVFSVFFIIHGTYALVKNKDIKTIEGVKRPVVEVNSQGGKATISVKHNKPINKIMYSWNDGEANEINTENKSEILQDVIIPNEDCVLNIVVTDSTGIESKYEQKFQHDAGADLIAPEINITAASGKINIQVTDNVELDNITYKWNDEQETKIEASLEDNTKINTEIEVKKGLNTLKIVATDKAGNKKEEQKDVMGASKPKISVYKHKSNLIIKVTDDDEVTKVEYTLNDTTYTKENIGENKKEFEIKQEMVQGENVIVIKAYNKSGLVEQYSGKTTYNP